MRGVHLREAGFRWGGEHLLQVMRKKQMMYASGVLTFFRILSCPSVRPPIWAGPDWTGFMFTSHLCTL